MRIFLYSLICFGFLACVDEPEATLPTAEKKQEVPAPMVPETPGADGVTLVPLNGSGLRFDGVYHFVTGSLHYYMRFFERGNAVFVGGTEDHLGQLSVMLAIDAQSGLNNVHNCPVVQRNDSLFIRSMSVRGSLDYMGKVMAGGDSIHFVQVSNITHTVQDRPYEFLSDARLAEEKRKFAERPKPVGR